MASFLKIIFIILIIYYALKFIGRIVFPWLLKRWITNLQKRYSPQQPFAQNNGTSRQEKDRVTVFSNKENLNKPTSKEGDYVDFEEIK
ncbi:MAG: DUF4834 family protein [Breznakibacter sp.]